MSENPKKYDLEELLKKKLGNFQEEPSESYWDDIDKGLSKARFYQFGWKHFNIYFLTIAVCTLLIGIVLLLFSFNSKNNDPVQSSEKNKTEIENKLPVDIQDKKILPYNKHEMKPARREKTSVVNTDTAVKNYVADTISKPSAIVGNKNITPTEIKKNESPAREYYIYETDTIIERDTVKVKKHKERKKR